MAIQLLPTLMGMLRGAVASPFRAAGHFGAAAGRLAGAGLGQRQTLNLAQLARQLGTPNPSPAQIAQAQQQINQNNAQFSMANRARAAGTELGHGAVEMGKFILALGTGTKSLGFLASVANDAATGQLRMFNPQIAQLAAQKEMADMRYAINRGRLVQGSTRALGQALMTNQREWQPYSAFTENLANFGLKWAVQISTGFENVLERMGITELVRQANKWFGGNVGKQSPPLHKYIQEQLAGTRQRPLNGRPNEATGSRM